MARLLLKHGGRTFIDMVVLWLIRKLYLRLSTKKRALKPQLERQLSALSDEAEEAVKKKNSTQHPAVAGTPRRRSITSLGEAVGEFDLGGLSSRQTSWTRQTSENPTDKSIFAGSFGGMKESRTGDCKVVICMVGLPARGKSYISKHLQRYLSFEGFGIRVFNAGDYRRKMLGAGQDADFFDGSNSKGLQARNQVAFSALEELLGWLVNTNSAHVGLFDATNTTRLRRQDIINRCARVPGIRVAFLESICTDTEILAKNYDMKLQNADYRSWDNQEEARADFCHRVARYETEYETVEEDEDEGRVSFMKVLNCGEKTVQRCCNGFLLSKVASYLLNMHIQDRTIYLTRHGESEDNARGKLGGDAGLTKAGMAYAEHLRDFMFKSLGWSKESGVEAQGSSSDSLDVDGGWLLMTSQLRRTRQTARPLLEDDRFIAQSGMRRVHTALLNEINSGTYDGFTAEDIGKAAPQELEARSRDKLRYRYPQGESYLDVVQRVRPLAMEMERERRPVLVIAHQAVLRSVLGFFKGTPLEEMPTLEIPLHTVLKLSIAAHGCTVEHVPLPHAGGPIKAVQSFTGSVVDEPVQGG